jgi:ketosteroid isomerase-like protein
MGTYEKSDRLLIFNNNGSATIGWDNVKSNVDSTYEKVSNVTLDITGLRIEMLGKTAAYVSCKWKQSQEYEGKLENAAGRMTLVFRLIGKDWKIVHRHTSPDNPGPTRPVFPSERDNN